MPDRSANPPKTPWCRITLLLLAANLVFGIGIIALLPPFEGADETAHFSRIQSQSFPLKSPQAEAANGQFNNLNARLSTDVIGYYTHGPMPYQWISFDLLHKGGATHQYMSYPDFFTAPQAVTDYTRAYWQTPLRAGFGPGEDPNWQYQHPPLFYLTMIPAMKALAGHASLITTMFALRLLGYLMGFAGFAIGLFATRAYLRTAGIEDADAVTAVGAFYPFLMPEFFWEFAHLGNDSLCLLLFGVAWATLLWHMRAPRSDAWIYLGVALGLGLLVKAVMAPVLAAVIVFLALWHVIARRGNAAAAPFKIAALALLLSLPIYWLNYRHGGSIGAINFQHALFDEDAWSLLKKNFAWPGFIANISGIVRTAIWLFGTWSLIVIDMPVYKALVIFTALVLVLYAKASCRRPDGFFHALPLWLIATFFAGLLSNVLVAFILQNRDATPGYYLHILAPAFALIYGTAFVAWGRGWKILLALFGVPVLLLNFFIALAHMTVFSGCAVPVHEGAVYRLHLNDVARCMGSFDTVIDRLGILAWPHLALAALALAFILLTAAAVLTWRNVLRTLH